MIPCGTRNQERYYPFYKFVLDAKARINWSELLKSVKVDQAVIEQVIDAVDMKLVCQYCDLSEEFIYKHADAVDWDAISSFQKLSLEFINKNVKKLNLKKIANPNNELDETFVYNHADELDWDQLIKYQKLRDTTMDMFRGRIDWSMAFAFQKFEVDMIRHFIEAGVLINWKDISVHQKLDEDFMLEYANKLSIPDLLKYQIVSENLRKELLKIKEELEILAKPPVTESPSDPELPPAPVEPTIDELEDISNNNRHTSDTE